MTIATHKTVFNCKKRSRDLGATVTTCTINHLLLLTISALNISYHVIHKYQYIRYFHKTTSNNRNKNVKENKMSFIMSEIDII